MAQSVKALKKQSTQIKDLEDTIRKQARQVEQLRDTVGVLFREHEGHWRHLEERWSRRDDHWRLALERVERAHTRELREELASRQKQDQMFRQELSRLSERAKSEKKARVTLSMQVGALIRHFLLPRDLPPPFNMAARRFQLRSQFEEDGILLALLEKVGAPTRRFVEIGSGASGGNSAVLALDCGWSGLMIDLSADKIERLRKDLMRNPAAIAVAARVSSDNVNQLLADHGIRGEVDVLSLDIDSYDYWVLEALDVCSPRVLIAEYNAAFGLRSVTIPNGQPLESTPKGYHGASLTALTSLAGRKGYRLVLCDESGVNAFFVRNDLAPDVKEVSVEAAFRPALSRVDVGQLGPDRQVFELAEELGLPIVEV
jgi:hypothetical protein